MTHLVLNPSDVSECRRIMRRHGVSYAFATRFFPPELRDATAVLYAFFRQPDDVVDAEGTSVADKQRVLEAWRADWLAHAAGTKSDDPVLRAAAVVFARYAIPAEYGEAFLQAMRQDLRVDRYDTYADLEGYMYGSAAVVGFMMSHVIGFSHPDTLKYAKALGEAMQLTNFIRDIKEDLAMRDRVYLPQIELQQFGVTVEDLRAGVMTPRLRELLKFEVERAHQLYALAEQGVDYLAPRGRFAVRLAARLYGAILTKIEAADYDVFTKRRRTSLVYKLWLTCNLWLKTRRG